MSNSIFARTLLTTTSLLLAILMGSSSAAQPSPAQPRHEGGSSRSLLKDFECETLELTWIVTQVYQNGQQKLPPSAITADPFLPGDTLQAHAALCKGNCSNIVIDGNMALKEGIIGSGSDQSRVPDGGYYFSGFGWW